MGWHLSFSSAFFTASAYMYSAPVLFNQQFLQRIEPGLCIVVKVLECRLAGLICGFAGEGFDNEMVTVNSCAGVKRMLARVPSAVFAPSEHGHPRYRAIDRGLCIVVKALEYSLAGLICGFAGQGFANGMMTVK